MRYLAFMLAGTGSVLSLLLVVYGLLGDFPPAPPGKADPQTGCFVFAGTFLIGSYVGANLLYRE